MDETSPHSAHNAGATGLSRRRLPWLRSLKARLALGAALLGGGTLLTAAILWIGMEEVATHLDKALAAEARIDAYATLSAQAATYLVIASEAVQSDLPAAAREERIQPISGLLHTTFAALHRDLEHALAKSQTMSLDDQSRYGTQSLGLARMEALLENTTRALAAEGRDSAALRTTIDVFSAGFDPLLAQAVNTELLLRNEILTGLESQRTVLRLTAIAIATLTVLAVAAFYFALIRPQFARLDTLRRAAHQIGQENFAISLPAGDIDEIGDLYAETNRMASALSVRHSAVQAEWLRLNETIARRTEALRTANARLAEIDENRRRFFADVSHELRTPLTVILMEARIGAEGTEDPRSAFATIESRAARLTRRIEDLLRVARSESGRLQLDPQPVLLTRLFDEIQQDVAAEIDSAGMKFVIGTPPPLRLSADANWIRQVLVSLIRNAIRHARPGGRIALSAAYETHSVEISVIDNGNGIAPADQARIFDRFAQGGNGGPQGFGIGLALARWVVEEHGGEIILTSPLPREDALGNGAGTKITVRLPRAKPESNA
ncbi:hypothetical protein C8N32_101244 [Rhodovulum imhoffii]|uniref:histidine kinase n=1 Tax=Rhodovulum imhoffii TaxID=365340 RepID=A0A2T5BWN3_9RHOB|nr:HAMP domain-containing sensor histidine kinase [Rhodovulum imhoffii]MBK5933288.1 histidine kinase [Rhodovulum imhoffii]PTN04046.1 hypothetical protein C8N32_101244 [Rhodovulum imhoffii]